MKKLGFKIVCVIAITIMLLLSIGIEAFSYSEYNYSAFSASNNIKLEQDNGCVYLLGKSNNILRIEQIYPNKYAYEIEASHNVFDYTVCNGFVIALCPVESERQTEIQLFDLNNNKQHHFYINGLYDNCYKTAYIGGYVYFVDCDDSRSVKIFNLNGKYIQNVNYEINICGIFSDEYEQLYICTDNNELYFANNNSLVKMNVKGIGLPCKQIGSNVLIDKNGFVYKLNNDIVKRLSNARYETAAPYGGVIEDYIIVADQSSVLALDINTGALVKALNIDTNIKQICTADNTIFVTTTQRYDCAVHISFSELKNIPVKVHPQNSNTKETMDITANIEKCIESSVYSIDNENMFIYDIPSNTTVAKFKKNMVYNGYTATFYNYKGKEIKSGNIGTGAVVRFSDDEAVYEYELSVQGDLTGEGNVNSLDKKLMYNYILNTVDFSGVYFISADMNKSENIDTVDLLMMMKQIEESNQKTTEQ